MAAGLTSIGNWSVSHPKSGDPVLESTEPSIPILQCKPQKFNLGINFYISWIPFCDRVSFSDWTKRKKINSNTEVDLSHKNYYIVKGSATITINDKCNCTNCLIWVSMKKRTKFWVLFWLMHQFNYRAFQMQKHLITSICIENNNVYSLCRCSFATLFIQNVTDVCLMTDSLSTSLFQTLDGAQIKIFFYFNKLVYSFITYIYKLFWFLNYHKIFSIYFKNIWCLEMNVYPLYKDFHEHLITCFPKK